MNKKGYLEKEIKVLREKLENTAESQYYDLLNPQVLKISKELDLLIVKSMRS